MIIFLKSLFKHTRIIESDSKFIPQIFYTPPFGSGWEGISTTADDTWINWETQLERCACADASQANVNLYAYLDYLENQKAVKKEIKMKNKKQIIDAEPRIWSILKNIGETRDWDT